MPIGSSCGGGRGGVSRRGPAESLADNRALDPAAALASVRSIAEALDIPGAASVELPRPQPAAAGQPVGQGSSQPVGQPTQPRQSARTPPGNAGSPPGAYPPAPPIGPPPGGGYPTESPAQIVNLGPHDAGRPPGTARTEGRTTAGQEEAAAAALGPGRSHRTGSWPAPASSWQSPLPIAATSRSPSRR